MKEKTSINCPSSPSSQQHLYEVGVVISGVHMGEARPSAVIQLESGRAGIQPSPVQKTCSSQLFHKCC